MRTYIYKSVMISIYIYMYIYGACTFILIVESLFHINLIEVIQFDKNPKQRIINWDVYIP